MSTTEPGQPLNLVIVFSKTNIIMLVQKYTFIDKRSSYNSVYSAWVRCLVGVYYLNCKYDVWRTCLSQSDDTKSYLWRLSLWECRREHATKTDPRSLLVNIYQIIPKIWLWKMVVRHIFSLGVYSCILFQRAARG